MNAKLQKTNEEGKRRKTVAARGGLCNRGEKKKVRWPGLLERTQNKIAY